jgi:hypothetical protein
MLTQIHPKLPMRNKNTTRIFYEEYLGFSVFGSDQYPHYLMMQKDQIQIHFFLHGQVYIRTNNIEALYQDLLNRNTPIHPNGKLETKPWQQIEFSLLDPDHNLLTFGQDV